MATRQHLRAAFVWSSLPTLVLIFFWIPILFIHGAEYFKKGYEIQAPFLILDYSFSFVVLVVTVWKFTLLLKSISEVQGFSIWKALLNLIFPILIACAIIFPPALLISILAK